MMLKKAYRQNIVKINFYSLKPLRGRLILFLRTCSFKKRYVRANLAPFIDKYIKRRIMKRSLRNKFLNSKSDTDRKAYNAQRNLCVSFIRQAKKQFLVTLIHIMLLIIKLFETFINRQS